MISIEDIQITSDLFDSLSEFDRKVRAFRDEGPLDKVSVAKLEEHFKASHIYNSAGIEGNRLTLQETVVVLKEGIDISGKPLKDSLEVKSLGEAFDFLRTLSDSKQTIREADIRSLHAILLKHEEEVCPGEYRKVGVIISGSEHHPPEPIDVPARMQALVDWMNLNVTKNPILLASIAHHELASIHPFKDGNGRVSRLLMNLILLKNQYPISNIRKEDRPAYYDALSYADVGLSEPLIQMVFTGCTALFSEYVRVREETRRMAEWAERWGAKENEGRRKRESREMELWQSRMRQVFLEFQKATELMNDRLDFIEMSFFDFKTEITFERYQKLQREGQIDFGNAFSISFTDKHSKRQERFMFRYFRNFRKYPHPSRIIPLELNYKRENEYVRLSDLDWSNRIRLRELYFNTEGEFIIRQHIRETNSEKELKGHQIAEAVQWFFDDVLKNVFSLS